MRLSVPSYLFPGTWLENLEGAASLGWVEGAELLFFRYDEDARSILSRELPGIAALAGRLELSVHLPDPLGPADEALVEATRPFASRYVIHPPRPGGEAALWARLAELWRSRYGDVFLLEYTGAAAFAEAESALPGLPLCPDTGALLREGRSPAAFHSEFAQRIGEIHLHGLAAPGSRPADHAPFGAREPWLLDLLRAAEGFAGMVELEIFSLEGVKAARGSLEAALAETATAGS